MELDFSSPAFDEMLAEVGRRARSEAFAAGLPVTYLHACGCYVQELPDGRLFEIRFHPGAPRDQHVERIREIPRSS